MAAALGVLTVVATIAILVGLSAATDHTVGNPGSGWVQGNNFTEWAQGQTFSQGDDLIFTYDSSHDVLEVTKASYDSCGTNNPIKTYTSGNDTIPLTSVGQRYFICGKAGHCLQGGMKLEVDTVAASNPSPGTPGNSPTPNTNSPPQKSGANSFGLKAKGAVGFGVGTLVVVLAF